MSQVSLFCEFCNISVHSDVVMKEHVLGRKHKKNQGLYDKRKELAARSVFTRGFPPKTEEATLKTYFSQFGEIQRLLFDKDRGIYAIVEYTDDSAVKKIFNQREHVVGGHRVVIKPREFKPPTPKPPDKRFPVDGRGKARAPPCLVEQAENKQHSEEFNFNIGTLPDAETLTELLSHAEGIDQQMDRLCAELKLADEDVRAREKILASLLDLFLQFYADCEVHVFGSSANGFGTKGCDMDIFLDMKLESRLVEEEKSGKPMYPEQRIALSLECNCERCKAKIQPKHRRLYLGGIKSLQGKAYPASAKDLGELTLFDKVKMLSRILCQFEAGCKDAFTIPSIRCPVVRFTHQPTGIKCDVSVNNRLALQNTKLLHLYCHLDPRVRPLVYTIRYWGKLKEVSTNPESGPRLTNYAVTLLVVFYLQNCDPPVLPTVEQLASHGDLREEVSIEGWDCSFSTDWKTPDSKKNNMTKGELLVGLFQFYCNIDFSSVVLSTRTGQVIPVSEFFSNVVKNDRTKNFKTGPVSVQDPFVLDHNITLNVNDKVRLKLVDQLNIALQLCSRLNKPSEVEPELWGLPLLLSEELPPGVSTSVLSTSLHSCDGGLEGYMFPLVLKMSLLPEGFLTFLHKSPDYRTEWVTVVCKFVRRVLEDILLFNVKVLSDRTADLQARVCRKAMHNVSLERDSDPGSFKPDLASAKELFTQPKAFENKMDTAEAASDVHISEGSTESNLVNPGVKELVTDLQIVQPMADPQIAAYPTMKDSDVSMDSQPVSDREAPSDSDRSGRHKSASVKRLSTDSNLDGPDSVKRCKTMEADSVTSSTDSSSFAVLPQSIDIGDNRVTTSSDQIDLGGGNSCTDPETMSNLACLRLECTAIYRTWNGRKSIRRQLIGSGVKDSLSLERTVSEQLRLQDSTASKPILRFSSEVRAILEPGKTAVVVTLEPSDVGAKEFTSFYPFLKTFVNKTVDKFLGDSVNIPEVDGSCTGCAD